MGSAGMGFAGLLLFLVGLLITAALLRWFFRINDIIKLLEEIKGLLAAAAKKQ